jgi:uncharacterized membrane-anchored protein YhcB (DUF1043 family)
MRLYSLTMWGLYALVALGVVIGIIIGMLIDNFVQHRHDALKTRLRANVMYWIQNTMSDQSQTSHDMKAVYLFLDLLKFL